MQALTEVYLKLLWLPKLSFVPQFFAFVSLPTEVGRDLSVALLNLLSLYIVQFSRCNIDPKTESKCSNYCLNT
mgnify:CR=1 FL=1|jgi:hypothetical protein